MLKVRLIPTLLLRGNRMVKGKQFSNFRDTGDPCSCARIYNSQFVDELIFLDIDATNQNRPTNIEVISRVSEECFMPLAIGGGIKTTSQVRELLKSGADKVVINTEAVNRPEFIKEIAENFGNQCVTVGIDFKLDEMGEYKIVTNSGQKKTDLNFEEHIHLMEKNGAGELFINSIDNDGMMKGYDLNLVERISSITSLPIIFSGGAGNFQHLVDALTKSPARALAMASIYHFGDNNPVRARSYLKNAGVKIKEV